MLRKTDHGPPESNRLSSFYGSVQRRSTPRDRNGCGDTQGWTVGYLSAVKLPVSGEVWQHSALCRAGCFHFNQQGLVQWFSNLCAL